MSNIASSFDKPRLSGFHGSSKRVPPSLEFVRESTTYDENYNILNPNVPRILHSGHGKVGLSISGNIYNQLVHSNNFLKWESELLKFSDTITDGDITLQKVNGVQPASDPTFTLPYFHTIRQNATMQTGSSYRFSFLAKAATSPVVVSHLVVGTTTYKTKFDLLNGTFNNAPDNVRFKNRMRHIRNGIYECSVFDKSSTNTTTNPSFNVGIQLNAGRNSTNSYPVPEGLDIDSVYIGHCSLMLTNWDSAADIPYINTGESMVSQPAEGATFKLGRNVSDNVLAMSVYGAGSFIFTIAGKDITLGFSGNHTLVASFSESIDKTISMRLTNNGVVVYDGTVPGGDSLSITSMSAGAYCVFESYILT